jgi:hypothetical protein
MIIMGGSFPLETSPVQCDAPEVYGMHNLNLGAQNWEQKPWYQYLPNVTSYAVPSTIIDVIGGG